jgi:lipid-binding SYLF domain-containing protein
VKVTPESNDWMLVVTPSWDIFISGLTVKKIPGQSSALAHRSKITTKTQALIKGAIMKKLIALLLSLTCIPLALAAHNDKEVDRVKDAGTVMKEILNIPDDIPRDLLDNAECVIVLPSVVKVAIGIGGSYGRGVMVCRTGQHFTGPWGAPAMYALEGGNIGFQLGGQATDFVLLVVNPRGAESLMGSKVKLGADAAAAAGPKGRTATAATDVVMRAEILSYSRSRGLFAGVSLEGSTLRPDGSANEKLYGRKLTAKEILREGKVGIPAAAHELDAELTKASPKNHSDPKSLQ